MHFERIFNITFWWVLSHITNYVWPEIPVRKFNRCVQSVHDDALKAAPSGFGRYPHRCWASSIQTVDACDFPTHHINNAPRACTLRRRTLDPRLHGERTQYQGHRRLHQYQMSNHRGRLVSIPEKINCISDPYSTQFLQGSIRHTPDAYLDELREALRKRAGKDVSVTTVWRTLRQSGFTMKQVCDSGPIFH